MKKVPTKIVKQRTRALTALVESFDDCYHHLVGQEMTVWVMDVAADKHHLVGHSKSYTQVLLPPQEFLLGSVVKAKITSASRWSVKGEVTQWIFNPHGRPSPAATPVTSNGAPGEKKAVGFWREMWEWTLMALLLVILALSVNVWLES